MPVHLSGASENYAGNSSWGRASNWQKGCPGLMEEVMEPKVPLSETRAFASPVYTRYLVLLYS